MRKFLVAAAAILAFGVVAAVAVVVATLPSRRAAPSPAPAEVTAPVPEAAAPPPTPAPVPAVFGRQQLLPPGASAEAPPPPPMPMGPPRPEPPKDSWEAVAPAPRLGVLGPVGGALGRGLNELQPKISACFDEDTQARYGQQRFTVVQDYAPLEDHGSTVLMLEVETQAGSVRIVDAPAETRGGASDGLIACAQRALRGQVIPAPQAQPGSRHRVRFVVTQ